MKTKDIAHERAIDNKIIAALGGTAEVARLCRVDMAAVSQWKRNGIPGYRLDFLKLARPDVDWEDLLKPDTADHPSEVSPPTSH